MPNLFDTHSLRQHFAASHTTTALRRVASAITTNQGTFDRLLLNDEAIRERAKSHQEGIDFSREQLSAMISKVQTLQGRLQTIYQSMLERYMVTNSDLAGTNPAETDPWNPNWRAVGRAAMLASKGAHAEETQTDTWADQNSLGRLLYQRTTGNGITYQERGGYYTTVNYLQAWDLHQIIHSYATGTSPNTVTGSIAADEILEVDSVDLNRFRHINWSPGLVIPLDPAAVFTPEFLASGVSKGDVRYDNTAATGYTIGDLTIGTLYAYVTEVESLPDGASRPKGFTLITSPDPTDYDGDGVPDSAVTMEDYLLGVGAKTFDLKLDYPSWDFTTMQTPSGWHLGFGATGVNTSNYTEVDYGGPSGNDMRIWTGARNPVENAALPGLIWDGLDAYTTMQPFNGWYWTDNGGTEPRTSHTYTYNPHAYFTNEIDFTVNPLRYAGLTYSNFATIDNDDDGNFYFSRNTTAGAAAVSTAGTTYATGWEQLMVDNGVGAFAGANMGLSATNYRALSSTWLEENRLQQTKSMAFYFHGTSGVLSGVTDPAGVRINGGLTIKTITGQDSGYRYYINEYGDIYDRFGPGNASPDDYDYVPDVATNEKENYVGNIFGARRSARVKPLDANGNGLLDAAETLPTLRVAARNYNTPDETLSFRTDSANLTAPNNLDDSTGSEKLTDVHTYNPMLTGIYLGFTEQDYTTVGKGTVSLDAHGHPLNEIRVAPFRTATSLSTPDHPTSGTALIDRNYQALSVGTTVRILNGKGDLIDDAATLSAQNADGTYTITPSAAVTLDPLQTYTIASQTDANAPIDQGARLGGSTTNPLTAALSAVLRGNEYQQALKYGLLDDLMLSASTTDAYGGQLSGRLTITWNKRQERIELFQNSFAAIYKSDR
jgi:hypothetical protein